jgi:phosphatidylglycerol---prolipoprotein diacylglyceryl transferase
MIKIGLSPIAFGNVSWWILFYSMGGAVVICSVWLLVKKGILPSYRFVILFALVTVLLSLLFARLFYVIDMREYYARFPEQIFSLNGLYMNGALLGAAGAMWLCSRVARVNFGSCIDAIVPGIIAGQMLGRVGCFLNGCCYGITTNLPWGITYTHKSSSVDASIYYHPWQIYEIVVLVAILWVLSRLKLKLKAPGLPFILFLTMYSTWRLAGGFLRPREDFFLGLQQAQVVSIAILVLSAIFLWHWAVKQKTVSDKNGNPA